MVVTPPGTGRVVVIGSGTAGYTLIRRLREIQRDRPICLVTADAGEVYSKPLLSNALALKQTPDSLVQKTGAQQCADLNVSLMASSEAYSIDPRVRVVSTSTGSIPYDQLVLATGARQRVVVPSGANPEWIHAVNSLRDYRRWHASLTGARRVLLIGAGLIGCEFADDLMSYGLEVELVDPAPWPLARFLPDQMGTRLAEELTKRGARLHMETSVERLDKRETRFVAALSDGAIVETDLVLCATGLLPQTSLAESAGLCVAQGVLVGPRLQTSDPNIFALGDCAETNSGVLPYLLPLLAQAHCLARVLAGQDASLMLKAMPVVVKTTSLRLVVCPPKNGAAGQWIVNGDGIDLTAIFQDPQGAALGFALSGAAIARRRDLESRMPLLLATNVAAVT